MALCYEKHLISDHRFVFSDRGKPRSHLTLEFDSLRRPSLYFVRENAKIYRER